MHPRFYIALAVVLCLPAAGCAGTNVSPGLSAANPASQAAASRSAGTIQAAGSFRSPQAIHRDAPALRVEVKKASYKKALYVADIQANDIKILTNTYYRELGTITDGINEPVAESMDQRANLYVANFGSCGTSSYYGCGDVTEYAPGTSAPSFTYNANMSAPLGVAVDRHGNLFEVDQNGEVNQYFQGSNYVVQSCHAPVNFYPRAITVDPNGDVFVAYKSSIKGDSSAYVYEYTGGLSGCNGTSLSDLATPDLLLDSNDDLILSSNLSGLPQVDILAPPYEYVNRQVGSGFYDPRGMSLSKTNKLLFVADDVNDNVTVINYRTGYNIKVLGANYGLVKPVAVVDAPNAVY